MEQSAVLITGAARRIGRGIAESLAEHGWSIALHCRQLNKATDELITQLGNRGVKVVCLESDLVDANAVAKLVPKAVEGLGMSLSALINNASVFQYDDWNTWTIESWDYHMAVNLRAPAQLMQAFAAQDFSSQKRQACIINIIDQRVLSPSPHFASYTTSKSALWAATKTAAQSYAPKIRVNAIGPGPVLQSIHQSVEDFTHQAQSTPLQRGTSVAEINQAVRFILDAPALTGQMITLDGGEHLDWRMAHGVNPKG